MSRRWRNIFFIAGLASVVIMILAMQSDWQSAMGVLSKAGIWFPVIVLMWAVVYLMNAVSYGLIVREKDWRGVPFARIIQLTVSGYALNYVTPFGLLGGEPYRIMELSGYVGKKKAASSTILYSMMHVCSHFCLWMTGIAVYPALHFFADAGKYPLGAGMVCMLSVMAGVFCCVLYLFSLGFRKGFVVKVFGLLCRMPLVRRWAVGYKKSHIRQLTVIDGQIASLHSQRRAPFWGSLLMEYAARVFSSMEYWLLIGLFVPGFTFLDGLLALAFSSLFSNLVFFSPMQLGGHEGGLAIAAGGLQVPGIYGVYVALITRVRELVWTVTGILLMKLTVKGKTDD